MTDPEPDPTVGQLLLAEYERLKDEQKTRIGFRDNLIYPAAPQSAATDTDRPISRRRTLMILVWAPVYVCCRP
jgi:hypothetical protein